MDNIRFQRPLCHIDYTGVWIANKMDGTPGADPLALSGGGQRQVFRSLFVRRVLFIPDRMVQPDLQAVEQAVYTAQRD